MADILAIISSSGGIAAGAPFTLGGALFVEQVSPPVAFTQRLAALQDAYQSVIAPGPNGSLHSFVLGEQAADAVPGTGGSAGDRSLVIGYKVTQTPGGALAALCSDQVLLGNNIQMAGLFPGNHQGLIAIGGNLSFTSFANSPDYGGSIVIGDQAKLISAGLTNGSASNCVVIGPGASAKSGSGIAIGASAIAGNDTTVAIGQNCVVSSSQSIAIGVSAGGSGTLCVAIGSNGRFGTTKTVSLGSNATANSSSASIAIGANANTNGRTGNIMFGADASVALDNFCMIGGNTVSAINELRFGAGYVQAVSGVAYILSNTTASGTNVGGNSMVLRPGTGTGNNANASNVGFDLQLGLLGSAGTTGQASTSVFAARHSDLNVAFWGGLGATFGGAVRAIFIGNATTAPSSAPTGGGLMYSTGGQLHWASSAGGDYAITPTSGGGGITGGGTATFIPLYSGTTAIGNSVLSQTGSTIIATNAGVRLGDLAAQGFRSLYLASPSANSNDVLRIDNGSAAPGSVAGTLTNIPNGAAPGNPSAYLRINLDGTSYYVPCWSQ